MSEPQPTYEFLVGAVDRLTREREKALVVKNILENTCAALRQERDQLQNENAMLLTRCEGTGLPVVSSPPQPPTGDK